MSIRPIQNSSAAHVPAVSAPKPPAPQGLASTPDRISTLSEKKDQPESLFKKFLFDPVANALLWVIRLLFNAVDGLRGLAFAEEVIPAPAPIVKNPDAELLQTLKSSSPQELLAQFERLFKAREKHAIYLQIGEQFEGAVSWKEMIWARSEKVNKALGEKLVRQNPELIREYLIERLETLIS